MHFVSSLALYIPGLYLLSGQIRASKKIKTDPLKIPVMLVLVWDNNQKISLPQPNRQYLPSLTTGNAVCREGGLREMQ